MKFTTLKRGYWAQHADLLLFFAHFKPKFEEYQRRDHSRALEESFGVGRSPLLGGNTLGHTSFWKKSLKKEKIEEKDIEAPLRFVYSLFPPLFSFLLMVVFSLNMFYFVFLGL